MPLLAPIELSGAEKLEILQRLDRYRKWQSLDDKRYGLACGHIIEGRDVLVVGGTRGTGPLRLVCSTRGCHSIPMDWIIPTDEVVARMSMLEEGESLPRKPANEPREKFSVRLGESPLHFVRLLKYIVGQAFRLAPTCDPFRGGDACSHVAQVQRI